ncbi:tetratricopeptide repeat protein [Bifidobacterium xylocopae]|uniref:Tetratricopeptide repeat protein n=1 Tax=Bifidobacterium xylocopae TaxID=2493119 RepID=A0A366KGZ6_9BIFI|nr:hypothetical protein CRD59_00375 [Bifidobacterium xylocopae]
MSKGQAGVMTDWARGLARGLRRVMGGLAGGGGAAEGPSLSQALENEMQAAALTGRPISVRRVQEFVARRTRPLHALDKRRVLPHLDGVPDGLELGWVQPVGGRDAGFLLGMFTDRSHFAQLAVADDRGRVFAGEQAGMDTQDMEPVFMFGKERQVRIPMGARFGLEDAGDAPQTDAIQGGIIGRDAAGRMSWLASWLKRGNRYTLEQLRPKLDADLRHGLEYRDAIAVSFFAAYLIPRDNGQPMGFGAGNIFRRLNREAPMGAIRRSVSDTLQAHADGLRTSGLEDYFGDLMREAGALKPTTGLEAVHGAEPMHLYASSYSGAYLFSWQDGMELSAALRALRIEGNLNRFAAVSAWLERNWRLGAYPIEDTVTRVQAAQLDQALIENPAISALQMEEELPRDFDPVGSDGKPVSMMLVDKAKREASKLAADHRDPARPGAKPPVRQRGAGGSEWVYRQAFSRLLRSLRLPFRFDAEFRSNLKEGQVAIAFTSAGRTMMPSSRFDAGQRKWVDLDEGERAAMSADYNLRVGLMMAALAFGADDSVRQVWLHVDSLGLEEAQAQQDTAIAGLMSQALEAFEQARTAGLAATGSKADPKDGDVHGDPNHLIAREQAAAGQSGEGAADGKRAGAHDAPSGPAAGSADEEPKEDVNQEFADLMQGVDLDAMSFATPAGQEDGQSAGGPEDGGPDGGQGSEDPMSALRRNPTVRNLVTVTFSREVFLTRLRRYGLEDPKAFYRLFDAAMDVDEQGGLEPVDAGFDMRDDRFAPRGSQDEPELEDFGFDAAASAILGTATADGLSIQRADLLERAMAEFRRLESRTDLGPAAKAQSAMATVKSIGDPELADVADDVTAALIDGEEVPALTFDLAEELDRERIKARDLLFSGDVTGALQAEGQAVARLDGRFKPGRGRQVARYFNSYAERVVYNRLFATPAERTLLIPDNLFYAHLEMADLLTQFKQGPQALKHLNAMVSYAPAYPLTHLKLAVQLARDEDWNGARAATLNALQVALDRSDAAFAYYRFAYASWMRDEFDLAAAAYIMSEHISPGRVAALKDELEELTARADSQCIPVPRDWQDARKVLSEHGLPVWPHTKVEPIVRQAARVCVDAGLFVPARTLSMAAARMNDEPSDGLDMVEVQFLQSLNA